MRPARRWVDRRDRGRQPRPGERTVLVAVAAVLILDTMLYSAVAPLLPLLQREFDVGDSGVGLLVAAYALGLLAGALPAGWLTARIGARAATIGALVVFAAASVGFGVSSSMVGLDVMRALQGVTAAVSWTAGFTWLLAVGPRERHGLLIGSAISASVAGAIAGPALGALAAHLGRAPVFAGLAVVALALAVALHRLPAPRGGGDLRMGAALRALSRGPGALAAWVVALAAGLYGAIGVSAPLRLDDLGAGATAIGAIFLIAGLSDMATGPVVGRVSDREGVRVPLLVSLAATAALLLAFALVGSLVLTVVTFTILMPAANGMVTPAFTALDRVADARGVAVAGVFGASALAYAGGESAGALVAGWLDGLGHGDVTYVVLAGLALATLGILWSLRYPLLARPDDTPVPDVAHRT